ncbi:glycosyl hydrolase [Halorhabdus sp. SVX81]|uniref:glycosyl hydrolase n=1 Tax=Halorhabdus sp. SVX81 TaxID=2978283 RepID=UPI0023D9D317|nr:glycosyl hydrolase [Halorhabdus sp. SVX81]
MAEDPDLDLSRRNWLKALGVAGTLGTMPAGVASAETIVGTGGYHDGPPAGADTHEFTRHTTADFGDGPIPTNDWYSVIGLEGITGEDVTIAAHPLAYKTQQAGLQVEHPTDWTTSWDDADQVGDVVIDDVMDMTISHADSDGYTDLALSDHGDWSVSAVFGEGTGSALRVTMAQGSPFVYCEPASGGVVIEFGAAVDVWAHKQNVVGLTVNGNDYGLYTPNGTAWSGVGSTTMTTGAEYCSIAVLPDSTYLETYEEYAYNVLRDTRFEWEYSESDATITTTFNFEVEELPDSPTSGTVAGLFPHHWKYSAEPTLDATYPSARGEMQILTGDSFSVEYGWNGMLPFLPDEGSYDRASQETRLNEVSESINGGITQDTYRFGKDTASRMAKCAAVADQVGMTGKRDALLGTVKDGLEEWFSPSDEATFYYDDSVGALQGYPGSHGSITDLSDHHFHFGHYVWAAARVARHDPAWAERSNWGGMVEELIRDYANPDRTDDRYPFNRNFSVYEGHSWAHGSGSFGLGNNQESSSEAMMAYAAMIEWGEYTGNTEIRDFGMALYAMQARAIQEYWMDRDQQHFPDDWEANFAGIVWGMGAAHSTWWTADSEAVYGINMLPLSGFSMHLGWDETLAERNFEQIAALKGGEFTYWPDILWMYRAFSDPQDAIDRFESRADSYTPEDAQEPAHTRYWLYTLRELGSPDPSVTADTPLYTVFDDGSERTYVAYNADDSATTVTFSDGTTLDVPANSMATSTGDGDDGGGENPAEQSPYGGAPHAIPGRIQAQEYDEGGQDVAYNDTTETNQGGAVRTGESVDIETVSDATGGEYNVGWIADGEWLEYTVNVEEAGTYDVDFRVASQVGGGTLHAEVGGSDVTGAVSFEATGGWQSWTTVTISGVELTAGEQVLRLSMDDSEFNVNWVEFTLEDDGGGESGDGEYAGTAGDGWSATVTRVDAERHEWSFEPANAADWADIQFTDPGTDSWVGYRMDHRDGDDIHVHTRETADDGPTIDFRFVWDDGGDGQYVSERRTHEF